MSPSVEPIRPTTNCRGGYRCLVPGPITTYGQVTAGGQGPCSFGKRAGSVASARQTIAIYRAFNPRLSTGTLLF
jgi:hypothetical protein